jgi:hypothetical protein
VKPNQSGDLVRVLAVPPSIADLPSESQNIFAAAVGKVLRVDEVAADSGSLALNVLEDGSQADDWCQHTIWLEPEFAIFVSKSV